MKTLIPFSCHPGILAALFLIFSSFSYCQSVLDYQTGTGVVVQTGADVCADQVIINGSLTGGGTICGGLLFTLNLTVLIQGFYNSSTNLMVSDTVRVYLRNTSAPYTFVDSSKSVLNTSGIGQFYFSHAVNGVNYYLVVRHRNSLETWSKTGQAFSTATLTYNFTDAVTKAYGDNLIQVDSSPIRFAIYSGDVTQMGNVDAADMSLTDNDASNYVTGYVNTDVTGNDVVDAADLSLVDNNAFNFVTRNRPPGALPESSFRQTEVEKNILK